MASLPTTAAWQVILDLGGTPGIEVSISDYEDRMRPLYTLSQTRACLKCFDKKGYIEYCGNNSFTTTSTGEGAYREYIRKSRKTDLNFDPNDPFC